MWAYGKRMNFIVLIILISLAEFVGDSNFKLYARNNKLRNLVVGILGYVVLVKLLVEGLKKTNLIFLNGYWNAIQTLIQSLLCIFILHETLDNGYQWLGLFTIVGGVFLLNVGKKPT